MTQMVEKLALILALLGLLVGLVSAQAGEAVPVLLKGQNEAQIATWKDDLISAFGEQTLMWVAAEKDADIVITAQAEGTTLFVRQNAIQRLSPILEPAPPVVLEDAADAGVVAALLWPLVQGNCADNEEKSMLDLINAPLRDLYRANCALIAATSGETPNHEALLEVMHQFEKAFTIREAKANWIWLIHASRQLFYTRELIALEILNPVSDDANKAFWVGKRGQFYALDFDYQAAKRDLDRAMAAAPDNPLYPTLKGDVYLLLYEWNNAKVAFDAAIALDPTFALAYFERGVLLSTMTDTAGANADFSMYLSLAPRGVYADLARQYGGGG